jgi:hypothetical protein
VHTDANGEVTEAELAGLIRPQLGQILNALEDAE